MKSLLWAVLAVVCLPALAQTHRYQVSTIAAMQSGITAPSPNTWYVGADGGTRYDVALAPTGQCDGKTDAAYPGTGTNQPCRFNDMRYLWTAGGFCNDGTATSACWKWVIAGGDTAIVHNCIQYAPTAPFAPIAGSSGPCGIGSQGPGGTDWGRNLAGDNNNGGFPVPPSGTPAQHTKILGANFAGCAAQSARAPVVGTYGVGEVFKLEGASYVDVACFDISDQSSCGRSGQLNQCSTVPGAVSNFAAEGVGWSNTSTHDTLTDVRIHGMAALGMYGPTGDGVVMTRVDLVGNAGGGWNADKGDGQTGIGSMLMQNYSISWNGCAEEYPIVDALPYQDCADDNVGGYGDGFGTATVASPSPGWQAHFDQGVVSYNTQDGPDALHLIGIGSSMTITRTLVYGNMGQQIKVGGAGGTARNNIIYTSCNALRQAIPGTPAGYNSRLSDFCRAADAGIVMTTGKGATMTFDNNTIYSASATGIEFDCDGSNGPCDATSLVDFRNNIFVGFLSNTTDGYPNGGTGDYSNPIYLGVTGPNPFTNPGSAYSNNLTFHGKSNWSCPQTSWGEANALCTDPGLTDETWHLYGTGNVAPISTASAIVGAGVPIPGLTADFFGNPRSATRPSIGAVEPTSSTSTAPPPVIVTTPPPVITPPPVVTTPPAANQPVAIAANMEYVCAEGSSITAFSVPSFVAQFGTPNASGPGFEPTFSFDATIPLPWLVWYTTPPVNTFDPAPSLGKALYAQQQANPYTVTCNDSAAAHVIPGLTPAVAAAAPVITWAAPAAIISGTVLSATQLNATANTAGTFVYSPASGAMPAAGTDTLSVAFTPTDTVHFTKAAKTVQLVVTKPITSSITCTATLSADGKSIAQVCQ